MENGGYCPMCDVEIPRDHQNSTEIVVCRCGWHDESLAGAIEVQTEKKNIRLIAFSFLSLFFVLIHFISWGSYSFSIPFVKLQKMIGTLSTEGYVDLAKTCIRLGKMDCAEDAYRSLYSTSKKVQALAELAKLQMRLGKNKDATHTFAEYVRAGGRNGDALSYYGRALESEKRFADALKVYERSIAARPKTLSVHAVSGIVRILMKNGRYSEARKRIVAFHKSSGNAKGYLNSELAQLELHLGKRAERSIASVPGSI